MAAAMVSSFAASLDSALSSEAEKSPVEIQKQAATEFKYRLLALPLTLLVAHWLTGTGFNMLAGMLAMLVHESGHALTAWLAGRWAIPTLWFTMIGEHRSWFMVLLVTGAILFGGFQAWRARRWGWVCRASIERSQCRTDCSARKQEWLIPQSLRTVMASSFRRFSRLCPAARAMIRQFVKRRSKRSGRLQKMNLQILTRVSINERLRNINPQFPQATLDEREREDVDSGWPPNSGSRAMLDSRCSLARKFVVLQRWNFGLCATKSREPRQARKGATVTGSLRVPRSTRSSYPNRIARMHDCEESE